MFPFEVLKDIFGALSRDNLDALMLANSAFLDVVLRDFAQGLFRLVERLTVFGCAPLHPNVEFIMPSINASNQSVRVDRWEFGRRMALCRVSHL